MVETIKKSKEDNEKIYKMFDEIMSRKESNLVLCHKNFMNKEDNNDGCSNNNSNNYNNNMSNNNNTRTVTTTDLWEVSTASIRSN